MRIAIGAPAEDAVAEHFVATVAHLAEAALLAATGRTDAAAPAADRAVEVAHRGAGRLELAHVLALQARTRGAGDGRPLLDRARAVVRSCPDPGRLPQRLVALQGALGGARPDPGGPRPASNSRAAVALSDRERELLPLLGGTLSQREIGAVLHLSLNTVKTHSRLLFRKLDVSSRPDAVRRSCVGTALRGRHGCRSHGRGGA